MQKAPRDAASRIQTDPDAKQPKNPEILNVLVQGKFKPHKSNIQYALPPGRAFCVFIVYLNSLNPTPFSMKKPFLSIIAAVIFSVAAFSQYGDTITVQTFTFGSPQDAWFEFPADTVRFEKILMLYTLKCNPAQNPACGEWDYLTYTYLYDHTGLIDSSIVNQPVFLVNGSTIDTVRYTHSPTFNYLTSWQYFLIHQDTVSLNTYTPGIGTGSMSHPFSSSQPVSRSHYLWRASELTAAGLTAGNISGIRLNVITPGSFLNKLTIRIKHTNQDTLSNQNFDPSGFTEVYMLNTSLQTGWNSFQFTSPFFWDGSQNIIIELDYSNDDSGTDNIISSDNPGFQCGLTKATDDRCISLEQGGSIDVAVNDTLAALDSLVTVTFWAYGDPDFQPQDGTCFEALNSFGNRVINTHVPWSNSNVYWDCGNDGGTFDRINKAAATEAIEGQWNFWAFTKNVSTGTMNIYLNGNLWHSGTGKVNPMDSISAFKVGRGNWSGSQSYRGRMDEFAVFSAELSEPEIEEIMTAEITPSHPAYNDLVLYYKFNDNSYSYVTDHSPVTGANGLLFSGSNLLKNPDDLIQGFTETTERPDIMFEQGVFNSLTDSLFVIDSLMNVPVQIITFTDSVNNPGQPVDTMIVWLAGYYQDVWDSNGQVIDSVFITPDSTMILTWYDYFNYFPQVIRYEIGRYITPYGNGLSLGDGWTWTFDVTDYRPLLADSVHLAAGNWQELLDLKFVMVKGIPPRDVVSIQNLWNGSFEYGKDYNPIENHLVPKKVLIPANAQTARWKSRVTGHGMDTPSNCAEFCAKYHYYKVNGNQEYSRLVWRDNCDVNPLYPQGGTWVYDRANWCPGAEVEAYDLELTPFIIPGDSVLLEHTAQPYTSTGGWNHYTIEDQLITYGPLNFTLDAAIERVMSPTDDHMWKRKNPICMNPVVIIKNNGSSDLTSLKITYGITGTTPSVYNWSGNLSFAETEEIQLDTFQWAYAPATFTVQISEPNGGTDEYTYNNTMVTPFNYVSVMPQRFVIELKTNNYAWQNSYELKDNMGNVVHSRSGLTANTTYRDTLDLVTGCYEFRLTDTGEDGLTWWANSAQGSGYIRFKSAETPQIIKNFGSDFGGEVYCQFTVGLTNETDDLKGRNEEIFIIPNPAEDMVEISFNLRYSEAGTIDVFDVTGRTVYTSNFDKCIAGTKSIDVSSMNPGIYFVTVKTGKTILTSRLIVR
jgi:hypothetical protein